MKVKPGTVKEWLRAEKKYLEARKHFQKYNKKILSLGKGIHKFEGCPLIKITEQTYSIPNTEEIFKLDPTLREIVKPVTRRKIKK